MKILRIKLRNLNSLRGEHVVDFTKEPLASAQIFAITGPTGAGKSTLLDAMTLALYGQAARYQNDRNPENMMSRHSSDCLAEVIFSVNQQNYRAEWQLRRAKGKIDGKIQAPLRYLYDANEMPMNRLATECTKEVERVTGLDYQRFLRSVLLAQGEFSRFLKASADERAELLESLTGTSIYSELGTLAHVECGLRDAKLAHVQTELNSYILLSETDIAEKQQQQIHSNTELQICSEQIIASRGRIDLANQRVKALTKKQQLQEQQQGLNEEKAQLASEWQKLLLHHQALPFARALQRCDDLSAKQTQNLVAFHKKNELRQQAQAEHESRLYQAVSFTEQIHTSSLQKLSDARKTQEQRQQQWQQASDQIEEITYLEGWAEALPALSNEAHQLHSKSRQLLELQTQIDTDQLEKNKWQQKSVEFETLKLQHQCTYDSNSEHLQLIEKQLQSLLSQHQSTDVDLATAALQTRQQQLRDAANTLKQIDPLDRQISELETAIAVISHQLEGQKSVAEQAKMNHTQADYELQLRREHLGLAVRMASLEEHRAMLKEGEECPLCGSIEHPYLLTDSEKPVIVELEKAVQSAQIALQAAAEKLTKIQQQVITLSTQRQGLTTQASERKKQREQLQDRLSEQSTILALNECNEEEIEAALASTTKQTQELQKTHKEQQQAQQEKSQAHFLVENVRQQWQGAKARIDELQLQLTQKAQQLEKLQQAISLATEALTQHLLPFQREVPDCSQHELSLKHWQETANHYQNLCKTRDDLKNSLEKNSIALDQLERTVADDLEHFQRCQTAAAAYPVPRTAPTVPSWQSRQEMMIACQASQQEADNLETEVRLLQQQADSVKMEHEQEHTQLIDSLASSNFADVDALRASLLSTAEETQIQEGKQNWENREQQCRTLLADVESQLEQLHQSAAPTESETQELQVQLASAEQYALDLRHNITLCIDHLSRDAQRRKEHQEKSAAMAGQLQELENWQLLRGLIGSHDGAKFRKFAQGISLDILTHHANKHLQSLSDRYRLQRQLTAELTLEIIDLYQANSTRPMASLSGGESFLVSLALALGLSDLAGRNVQIDSLFIDEGFGTLDADALDAAISTLESLHQQNKTIGVISHIDLLKERISTKINVRRLSAGESTLEVA